MEKYCCVCGRPINGVYYKTGYNRYVCNNKNCFETNFWDDLATRISFDKFHEYAIINREVYQIGSDFDEPKGFSGNNYTILFKDGTIRNTTSLWLKGKLPARLIKDFPDNAFFEKGY